jgi:putative ABC transport system permease protein
MHSTLPSIRNAIRFTRRDPGFVALVVFSLAIGIGATTAAVNVASSVLLTPLPVRDESRLLLITKRLASGSTLVPFSYAEMTAWAEASRTLETVAGVQYDGAWPWPAKFGDRALTVTGTAVSGNFFSVLGAQPVLGRLLAAEDARTGAEEVAVIGYDLWRRQFGGDLGVVGQRIRLSGPPATIVGVAQPGFAFPKGADVWQPLGTTPDVVNEGWFTLVGRLKPNATVTQAVEESVALLDRIRSIAPARSPDNLRTGVVSLKEAIVGDVRPVMGLFVAAAILLFLVGCINVMNLLLVRGTTREREMSVCAALGATRWRLIGQLMTETTVFATAGGVFGALVAFWLQRALIAAAPAGLPRLDQIRFDDRTLGLAVAGSLLCAVLAGVAPAFWTVRRSPFSRLRSSLSHGSSPTYGQIGRQMLVASQLAFALLVTVAAALLVKSLQQLQAADLGFSPHQLSVVQVPLVGRIYDDPERRQQFFDELVSRMEALPGIAAATPVLLRPFTGTNGWDATFTRERQERDEASANPGVQLEAVRPNYFSTMGIPIVSGRTFAESDRKGTLPVVIIAKSLARYTWPGSAALGKRLKFGTPESSAPWMTVVGIVGHLRYRDLKAPPPAIYVPVRQTSFPARFLIVRASIQDAPLLSMTQRTLKGIDPAESVTEAASITELLANEMAGPRFQMLALGLFAVVAVLLAAVGVFGVLATFVAQRSRELGLRVALGAKVADLRGLVLSKVGWPTALGLSAGTCAAFATTPLLRPLLFQVSAFDSRAFAEGWIVLVLVTLLAALVPARRAGRVDPARLLRSE